MIQLALSLKIIFSVVLLSSYAVQFLVVHDIVFGRVKKWISNSSVHRKWDVVVRIIGVAFTVAIAAVVPTIGIGIMTNCC